MLDENRGNRFIFIGGAPRSGTTLVQNMLDSHPDILGGPEFLHIPDIMRLRKILHRSISREYIDLFCSHNDVDRHITFLIKDLLLPLTDKQGCKFLSEKTPENVLVFSELIELFPQAHFIHVIRDPRAIVSSMQQVGNRAKDKGLGPPPFTANISASIAYIKKCFNAGFAASKNAPGKVLTVAYERLVMDPERETKRICKFLELEWTNQMITPGNKKHLGEKAITCRSNEIWYNAKTYYRNPDSQNIEKWKSQLTLAQQVRITMAFEDYEDLKEFEFEYGISSDSLTQGKSVFWIKYVSLLRFVLKLHKCFAPISRRVPGVGWIRRTFFSFIRF